ncbi:unnamed protein product [Dracunculus medinensis]|uniref:Hamartin n=1 Tax=Dracunculus medinensis TaxID=318479 RepID=A0A0N4UCH1_DRAME|nr:unnamed protein product [Dracunculus medinensis]
MSGSGRTNHDIMQLIRYSDSLDSKVSENSREALKSLIDQGEAISQLVDYYTQTQSRNALNLLCRIKEPHDKELCNRLQEHLEKHPMAIMLLLSQIVQKAPCWLTKFPEHSLFATILRLIHLSQNVTVIVGGILLISSLIPHCSIFKIGPLEHLFCILVSSCVKFYRFEKSLEKNNKYGLNAIYLSHMYCAIMQYFIVLYGIYPVNLLTYLRDHRGKYVENKIFDVLNDVIAAVKLHPHLIKSTAEQELDRSRWLQRESHDFLADCRHILIRPVINTTAQFKEDENVRISSIRSSSVQNRQSLKFDQNSSNSLSSNSLTWFEQSFQSNSNLWDDEPWSPSISLGLDTPPNERTGNSLAYPQQNISGNAIVPSDASSRRSTSGSIDYRKLRHSSFGQKLSEIFRRKFGEHGDSKSSETVSLVVSDKIPVITDEFGDADSIEVVATSEEAWRRSQEGQIEEGVDARDICIVPSAQSEKQSCTSIAPSNETDSCGAHDSIQIISSHPTLVHKSGGSHLLNKVSGAPLGSDDSVGNKMADYELDPNNTESHFSVASFSRAINRQQFFNDFSFLGEQEQLNLLGKQSCFKPNLVRCSSCPCVADGTLVKPVVPRDFEVKRQLSLTAMKISEVINRKFPYLAFLHGLSFMKIDEKLMDSQLKKEHERCRRDYMEASHIHHTCLKQLGLADRLPNIIIDEVNPGLSLEKQRDLLSNRLLLIRHHLMYERCGRLLHAERNRRLFGRIKQQKLSDAEKISLQKALHNARIESEEYVNELTSLRFKVEQLNSDYQQMKVDFDKCRRRCENAEAQLSLSKSRMANLESLRPELEKAHRTNQILLYRINQHETSKKTSNCQNANDLSAMEREQLLLFQVTKLRGDLDKERNVKDSLRGRLAEIDEEWKREKQKNHDLKLTIERIAMLHEQQSEAAQHKFRSLLSICQKQQSHILDLNSHIEKISNDGSESTVAKVFPLDISQNTVPEELWSCNSSFSGHELETAKKIFQVDLYFSSQSDTSTPVNLPGFNIHFKDRSFRDSYWKDDIRTHGTF